MPDRGEPGERSGAAGPGALAWALARAPATLCAAAGAVVLGLGGGALPLLDVPGFELGLVAALASALAVGPGLGLAAARRAARGGRVPVLCAFAAAAGVATALLLLLFVASAGQAALRGPCRPLAGAPLFALVAWPSALLATALGVAAGAVAGGRRGRGAALYALAVAGSLLCTALAAYRGPSASLFDHLLGWWPGPLYDEALAVDRRLLLFRLGTLCWAGAALVGAALRARAGRGARPAGLAGPGLALAVALAGAAAARAGGGGPAGRRELAEALGAVREGPRCVVHLAAERGPGAADRALRDCEYDAQEVASALGLAHPPRATVWIYRSAAEKRRLVGAGRTSFTKPWLHEIHLQDEGLPHPLLRHELVHALAAAAARGPLRVPARAGVLVDAGFLEGLAVAVDVPADGFGVDAWARALRDEGRLPPVRALLGPAGFWGAAPARAYTATGSFLRWLLATRGPGPVMAAYADDDLPGALGASLEALEEGWHRHLDGVAVPRPLAAAAEARFAPGSLFARACPREVAGLEEEAGALAGAGRASAAEALLRRASALSGGDPAYLRAAAEAWREAGDLPRAEGLLAEALRGAEAAGGRGALRGALLRELGDLRWRAGDPAAAAVRWRAALALDPVPAEARALSARLAAAADPRVAAAVAPWLLSEGDPALALARVAGSRAPLARYLLGRARLTRGAPREALEDLLGLDPAALPDPALAGEARRLLAEALCLAGRAGEGVAAWRALAAAAPYAGLREQAEDGARRCAFEASPLDRGGPRSATMGVKPFEL